MRRLAALRMFTLAVVVLLLTTGCFITDLFDFDKDDGSGCPPDRVDSVCTPIDRDAGMDAGIDSGPDADSGPARPCPLIQGSYRVSGCPATSCVVTQAVDDCFAQVSCQTSIGLLSGDTFIDEDGSFHVSAGAGSCQLMAQSDGTVRGTCTDFIGIDSCAFVGTP